MSDSDNREHGEILPPAPKHKDTNSGSSKMQLDRLFDIEEKRIDSHNKRTDVYLKAIDAQNASDQRQYEFSLKELDVQEEIEQRRDKFVQQVFWCGGGGFFALILLVLYMVLFGDTDQSRSANNILGIIGHSLGGGGAIYLASVIVRWFTARK